MIKPDSDSLISTRKFTPSGSLPHKIWNYLSGNEHIGGTSSRGNNSKNLESTSLRSSQLEKSI